MYLINRDVYLTLLSEMLLRSFAPKIFLFVFLLSQMIISWSCRELFHQRGILFLTVKKMSMRYHSFKVFKTHYNFWKIFSIPDQYIPLYGHLILAAFKHTPLYGFLAANLLAGHSTLIWCMCISGTTRTDCVINIIEYI